MGQIAGRAGRHIRDGTFGVSGHALPLGDETVERIETHEFDSVKVLQWRSRRLDFSSIADLRASLETPPQIPGMTKALPAIDPSRLPKHFELMLYSGAEGPPASYGRLMATYKRLGVTAIDAGFHLAQVVRARLEAQTEKADSLMTKRLERFDQRLHLALVAWQQPGNQR